MTILDTPGLADHYNVDLEGNVVIKVESLKVYLDVQKLMIEQHQVEMQWTLKRDVDFNEAAMDWVKTHLTEQFADHVKIDRSARNED